MGPLAKHLHNLEQLYHNVARIIMASKQGKNCHTTVQFTETTVNPLFFVALYFQKFCVCLDIVKLNGH